jgi:molecular chaperone DnaK
VGTYALGIDLGTTFVGAAIVRGDLPEIVPLGNRAAVVPSLVFFGDNGEFRIGEAALPRAVTAPSRVAREFKRRFGDATPYVLGGTTWSSEALMARLLRWTVDAVSEREGSPPDRIAFTHPANWGPYKLDLLTQVVRLAEVKVDRYLSEPEAAAFAYAAAERLPLGDTVAVYDLGGGTFDATVLRAGEHGFEILGNPEGIERLGGIDIDQIMLAHVADALEGALDRLDPDAPTTLALLARLRQDCVDAKEQLSSDTEATIPVTLPDLQTEVRITRAELEAKIAPPLHDTIRALRRTLASASIEPADLRAVLLVGGASRMPIVADLVSQELGRPVALDAHPKHSIAIGAALAARGAPVASAPRPAVVTPVPVVAVTVAAAPTPPSTLPPAHVPPLPPPATSRPSASDTPAPPTRGPSKALVGAIGGLAVAVLVLAGVFVLRGGAGEAAAFPIQNPAGAAAPTGVVNCPQGTAAVCISDLRIDNGQVAADFTSNVQLSDPVDGAFAGGTVHPLFFWDTQGPSQGRHWGSGSPFTGTTDAGFKGFTEADVPTGATLCVVLIDNEGTWVPDTGNCVSLD